MIRRLLDTHILLLDTHFVINIKYCFFTPFIKFSAMPAMQKRHWGIKL